MTYTPPPPTPEQPSAQPIVRKPRHAALKSAAAFAVLVFALACLAGFHYAV